MEVDPRPLAERDPLTRFTVRADEYVRFRPTYPAAAVSAALAHLPDPALAVAADVGAGTGISARLLADRGARVMAVEPNAAMRSAASPHQRVTWVDGTAESTTLDTGSVDLVLCAQSFHWFEQERALAEFRRILRSSGRLAILWNDDDPGDPAMVGYRAAVGKAADRDWPRSNPFSAANLETLSGGRFERAEERTFGNEQALDVEGLIGRARSASYVPRDGPRYDQMVVDLRALHGAYADAAGLVRLRYRTILYLASPREPG